MPRRLKPAASPLFWALALVGCRAFAPPAGLSPVGKSTRRARFAETRRVAFDFEGSPSLLLGNAGRGRLARRSSLNAGAPAVGLGMIRDGILGATGTQLISLLVAAAASILAYRHRTRLLWPRLKPDPARDEPLPPSSPTSLGCPLFGMNFNAGSERYGPEYMMRRASESLGNPRVWASYFLGRPVAVFSGLELVRRVNEMEFSETDASSAGAVKRHEKAKEEKKKKRVLWEKARIIPVNNLLFERDKEMHGFLRQLVGAAMTPQALKGALPTIQKTARDVIEREVLRPSREGSAADVKMEDVCMDYTMDIVQNQLLGLELDRDEVHVFRDKLRVWVGALYSLVAMLNLPWVVKRMPSYRAKEYIVSKIEEKIDSLLEDGPDESTLSNMLYAVDEGGGSAKLTREQVVENAQLLIIAGSENSAGTLTLAMLLLGLHPENYERLVQEQMQLMQQHGDELTPALLEKEECPYLDAVVREALRMGPVTAGFPRSIKETVVVDGVQVPENWAVMTTYRLTHQLDPSVREDGDAHMDPRAGFRPERWLDPETEPEEWVPFGVGPRFCLGYNLAMMQMKVFLAELARTVGSYELANHYRDGRAVEWNPRTMVPRPSDGVLVRSVKEVERK